MIRSLLLYCKCPSNNRPPIWKQFYFYIKLSFYKNSKPSKMTLHIGSHLLWFKSVSECPSSNSHMYCPRGLYMGHYSTQHYHYARPCTVWSYVRENASGQIKRCYLQRAQTDGCRQFLSELLLTPFSASCPTSTWLIMGNRVRKEKKAESTLKASVLFVFHFASRRFSHNSFYAVGR